MGILNLTPDSFSDGGQWAAPEDALRRALVLQETGADILDLGAESTRPGHTPVTEEEELRRLLPALKLIKQHVALPVSVDTQKAAVAEAALAAGADMLNDVGGLRDPAMRQLVQQGAFPVVLMHGVAHSLAEDDESPAEHIAGWFAGVLPELGIAPDRLCLDPGIGFGTTRRQDAAVLEHLAPLTTLGLPVLVALSRKRVVRECFPDATDLDEASVKMAWKAWRQGAAILRLHEPAAFLKYAAAMEDGAAP